MLTIPPLAAYLFRKKNIKSSFSYVLQISLLVLGIITIISGYWLGIVLIAFGITGVVMSYAYPWVFGKPNSIEESETIE